MKEENKALRKALKEELEKVLECKLSSSNMTSTLRKEIYQREPEMQGCGGVTIRSEEYCEFMTDMLKVAYPNIDEETRFKNAGMYWLYSVKQSTSYFRGACYLRHAMKTGDSLRYRISEYQYLCNLFPDDYNMDGLENYKLL